MLTHYLDIEKLKYLKRKYSCSPISRCGSMFQVVCSGVNHCWAGRRELRLQGQHQPQKTRIPRPQKNSLCPLQALRESQIQSSTAQHMNQALSV